MPATTASGSSPPALTSLAAGATTNFTITVNTAFGLNQNSLIADTATIAASESDPTSRPNNTATTIITASRAADLNLTIAAGAAWSSLGPT